MSLVDQDGLPYMSEDERTKASILPPMRIAEDVRIQANGEDLAVEITFTQFTFRQRWALLFGGMLQTRLSASQKPQGIYARGVGIRIITPRAWKKYQEGL